MKYKVVRDYFRFTRADWEALQSPSYTEYEMHITGRGKRWAYGELTLVIPKKSGDVGWEYLKMKAATVLNTSIDTTSSGNVPGELLNYIQNRVLTVTQPRAVSPPIRRAAPARTTSPASLWPTWPKPNPEEIRKTLELIAPYIRFLHPRVIDAVVKQNSELTQVIDAMSESGIDVQSYYWDRCPTAFPGVRRSIGGSDKDLFKKVVPAERRKEKQALFIDDNNYAKQIWSILLTGREFRKKGPVGYELAHLFHHKKDKRFDIQAELKGMTPALDPIRGFFTSACGIAFVPTSLARATDLSLEARKVIQKFVVQKYSSVCQVLPPGVSMQTAATDWNPEEFKFDRLEKDTTDPELLRAFLAFRKMELFRLINRVAKSEAA